MTAPKKNIYTNYSLLLNKQKKKIISQLYLLSLRTNNNAKIKIRVAIKKKLCKINAGEKSL